MHSLNTYRYLQARKYNDYVEFIRDAGMIEKLIYISITITQITKETLW